MANNSLRVSYAIALHDDLEKQKIISVLDEHRTIIGKETKEFEERVAKHFGKKFGVMVNSGSSANLLSLELLDLPKGSEVITPLLTFSTTAAPLLQKNLVPVFVDVEQGKYTINIDQIEKAITKKTKALMIPLLIGNVPNLKSIRQLAKKHQLYFIEDSCDTLGATFLGKPSGTYSDVSTTSFYGSHIITAGGGGGMLLMNNKKWYDRARVFRGWGRNSSLINDSEDINKRYTVKLDSIPYDAKFIFSEVGYNFMPMEIGAAFGNAQLDKLNSFKKTREKNFRTLFEFFKQYEHLFILPVQDKMVQTQWLAFPLTIKKKAPFTRLDIVIYLEENNIQTRPIFTGNILKQPGFKKASFRLAAKKFPNTDEIMKNSFLIGCHHGLTEEHIDKIKHVFTSFIKKHS